MCVAACDNWRVHLRGDGGFSADYWAMIATHLFCLRHVLGRVCVQAMWQQHRATPDGEPDCRWGMLVDHAIAYMARPDMENVPVRLTSPFVLSRHRAFMPPVSFSASFCLRMSVPLISFFTSFCLRMSVPLISFFKSFCLRMSVPLISFSFFTSASVA